MAVRTMEGKSLAICGLTQSMAMSWSGPEASEHSSLLLVTSVLSKL